MIMSVIIPAYNAETTLAQSLSAVRQSKFNDYELIVVDDGSSDQTEQIAQQHSDQVISHEKNLGPIAARQSGVNASTGELLVFIDSDIMIYPDTLEIIYKQFNDSPKTAALTGLLSPNTPITNFSSQYKALYMHYSYSQLPDDVNFVYGSIFALRRELFIPFNINGYYPAEDTEYGQVLTNAGLQITFLPHLQVTHLKRYTLPSLVKNDFIIPFQWSRIFLYYYVWKSMNKQKLRFAHATTEQIISLLLVPCLIITTLLIPHASSALPYILFLVTAWIFLNYRFFQFIYTERKLLFTLQSIIMTFFDNVTMFLGIVFGSITELTTRNFLCRRK